MEQSFRINNVVLVYNDERCKLGIICELLDKEHCYIHPIFSGGASKLKYKVKYNQLEVVSLLYALDLYNRKLNK